MSASPARRRPLPPPRQPFAGWLDTTNAVTQTFLSASGMPDMISLAGGLPAPELYPAAELATIARDEIANHPQETLGYGPVEGLPVLRDLLAARFSTPALRLTRANVLVTSGGMQGLDLVGKVLLDKGGLIAGHFPTYLGAIDAWRPRDPTFRNLDLEDPRLDPEAALDGASFAYAVPNFSNPTGRLVGTAMRSRLVDAAHATGTWLVEDDPYGRLHFDGEPLPNIIELCAAEHGGPGSYDGPVIYMGTMSKELAPGLRVGWVIAAPEVIVAMTAAKQGSDMCTSGITQRIAAAALSSGMVDRAQPAIVSLYRERRDALCDAIDEHLSGWFSYEKPVGGMFVWAVARDPAFDTDALLSAGLAAGICIAPSSVFDGTGEYRRAMRLNFTFNPPDRLREGMRRLARVMERAAG